LKNILVIFLVSVLCLNACKSNTSSTLKDTIVHDTTSKNPDPETEGIPVDYDHAKIIKAVYVTDRNGLIAVQQTDPNSKKLVKYDYGDKLDVIEIKGDWLGIIARVNRKYRKNGHDWESSGWEKVYVQAKYISDVAEIKLIADELNIIVNEDENDQTVNRLTHTVDVSLVDKQDYDAAKSLTTDYLVQDTLSITKKKGVIELPYGNKIKRYVDKPDAEDETKVFTYVGNIPFLNKYVLSGTYYESSDYKLIDKETGEETASLNEMPNISKDKKYLIAVSADSYGPDGLLELYSISNTKLKIILTANFKDWMPAGEGNIVFWGNDDSFYVQVLHTKAFWKADGNLNDKNYQYLKIKIK
jgi:hypothetical protein